MKIKLLCATLALAGFFVLGPKLSLEAGHHRNHLSVNVGPMFPVYPRTQVVEYYPSTYVEEYHYYPNGESVTVYRSPRPVVREVHTYPARSSWFGGLSLGFFFR